MGNLLFCCAAGTSDLSRAQDHMDWDEDPHLQQLNQDIFTRTLQNTIRNNEIRIKIQKHPLRSQAFPYVICQDQVLGKGTFAKVLGAVDLITHEQYAVKIFVIHNTLEYQQMRQEVALLQALDHPNIVQCQQWYQITPSKYYFVLEMLRGGALFDQIVSKTKYNEHEAIQILYPLLQALKYLHQQQILHRDLKPENILFDGEIIKLCDFGFASVVREEGETLRCGSPLYVAPEIVLGIPYGVESDMWSVGVIAFILLSGVAPFNHDCTDEGIQSMFRQIIAADFAFDAELWKGISKEAKDFVLKLLDGNPMTRSTAEEMLQHAWITEKLNKEDTSQPLHATRQRLRRFSLQREGVKEWENEWISTEGSTDSFTERMRAYSLQRKESVQPPASSA